MKTRYISTLGIVAAIMLLSGGLSATRAAPGEADPDNGAQILTRGPIHEAFAETVVFDPKPGVIVAKMPPAAIEEVPPDQRPEGANVAWIPGYWAWDDERSDFLWVSGIWRDLPPGRQWIPGYWAASGQGAQWTSGYWADAQASEVEYLPEPPATVEAGPNIAAASASDTWLPGSWVWRQSRYAWQPGNWAAVRPDSVWMPAHYIWAPRGYVFVDGYWDYSIGRRGVLFAPVFFNANVYSRRGFAYSPATVIDLGVFSDQLFLRPNYCHYYFGDYYAASYATAGYCPSFSYQSRRYGYDPIYAHQSWEHRSDPGWGRQMQANFDNRRDHQDARPPRTLAAQTAFVAAGGNARNGGFVAATSLDQFAKRQNSPVRFQPVTKVEQQQFAQHGQAIQKFSSDRRGLEAKTASSLTNPSAKGAEPSRVKLPESPLASKSGNVIGKENVPPGGRQVLKPELGTDPKPRGEVQPRPSLEPQPEPKPTPRPTLTPKSEPRPTLDPKAEPRPAPEPRVAPQPTPVPKVEPRPTPAPKAEPRPTPEPRIEPRPMPTPKVEPRPAPAPKAEPRPAPEAQPKPARDPNDKPK